MEDHYLKVPVVTLEEAIPLLIEGTINIVCYTKFYDKQIVNTYVLQKEWPIVGSCLREYGVVCALDLEAGKMEVSKTKETEDEDVIFKAIDILHLLSRNVPAGWAIHTMDCSCEHDIIEIRIEEGGICRLFGISQEQFLARRNLIIGVVKDLAKVSGCAIFGKGSTIAVLGSLQGIKMVKKIVKDCMAHGVPPAPRVRKIMKKIQPKKNARIKMTSEVMMSLESLCLNCKSCV